MVTTRSAYIKQIDQLDGHVSVIEIGRAHV